LAIRSEPLIAKLDREALFICRLEKPKAHLVVDSIGTSDDLFRNRFVLYECLLQAVIYAIVRIYMILFILLSCRKMKGGRGIVGDALRSPGASIQSLEDSRSLPFPHPKSRIPHPACRIPHAASPRSLSRKGHVCRIMDAGLYVCQPVRNPHAQPSGHVEPRFHARRAEIRIAEDIGA
jgi:hypothetical protein